MAEEETGQEVAAEEAVVTDDMLNAAAADAVVPESETETEEIVEELETTEETEVEQETEEVDDEGLPADHGKRSDLGRKVSAMHRRQDDSDARLDRILQALETQTELATRQIEPDPLDVLDPDAPMTKAEIDKYLEARERKAEQQISHYDKTYLNTFNKLSVDLPKAEAEAIVEEMKVLSYNPSTDPAKDAEVNFLKAERSYLRKQLAKPKGKVSPITGKHEHSAIGTVTSQKVVTKETVLPKLDAAGMSYLAFVESEDGPDKAKELHKSLGRG